jgi:hypothetical protein
MCTNPFCHCEARSAVAIHVFVRRPMDRFVPRDDKGGLMKTILKEDMHKSVLSLRGAQRRGNPRLDAAADGSLRSSR